MNAQNLNRASVYINNLLLSRGLLRNGKPIDFAQPGNDSDGPDATMVKIINLVHDLVLRRDRETDQRENLATTIRTLRNTETKQGLEIERLKTQNADLTRSVSLAEGQERAFKSTIRNAEASARSLREQMSRMKSTLQHVRTQCANDIRKRDIQIQKLKQHLTGMQRGRRDGLGVSTIAITPLPSSTSSGSSKRLEGGEGLDSPGYSLKQETTEFLTGLAQNLSDENDSLISLAKDTIETLRNLQGLPASHGKADRGGDEEGLSTGPLDGDNLANGPLASHETLAAELDHLLDHLRALLTNPSFVPIEELEVRDEEIHRLREGWVQMEGRWKEALQMMEGWKKRMDDGGDSIRIEELKVGLDLGRCLAGGAPPPPLGDDDDDLDPEVYSEEDEAEAAEEENVNTVDSDDDDDDDDESSSGDVWLDQAPRRLHPLSTMKKPVLGEAAGNARSKHETTSKVRFQTSPTSTTTTTTTSSVKRPPTKTQRTNAHATGNQPPTENSAKSRIPPRHQTNRPGHPLDDDDGRCSAEKKKLHRRDKASEGGNLPPSLTVSEKLAAVEIEATIARKEEQTRRESGGLKRKAAPSSKSRVPRAVKAGRRRSTLSPEELEELMGIS